MEHSELTSKLDRFLDDARPATPCLVIDLDVVDESYRELERELPDTELFYAVKANPSPVILQRLAKLGASFDLASPGEIDLCLGAGIAAKRLSYSNTVRKCEDIAYAHGKGVTTFTFDSEGELQKLARLAPGARVFCRISVPAHGASYPLSRKFGCDPEAAQSLLGESRELGLIPEGIAFHVGSQQVDPSRWADAIGQTASIFASLRSAGIVLTTINLGGGFPVEYTDEVPSIRVCARVIRQSLWQSFQGSVPRVWAEPGRCLVARAGTIFAEVILVTYKGRSDSRRWVYLDIGTCNGLITTTHGFTRYAIRTRRDSGVGGPAVIAGPTCSDMDILYDGCECELPLGLEVGDRIAFLCAGAYTASLSMTNFNGFGPLKTYCV